MENEDRSASLITPSVSLPLLLWVWLSFGLQSFGGGVATLTLIRRAAIDQYHWLTEDEFTRDWALCQIAPGINLLALTILIGRRVAGWKGMALAMVGLLLPSVTLTILVTAFYARFKDQAVVRAALHGVIPATVGLGLLTAYQMARPLLAASRRVGRMRVFTSVLLLACSGVVFGVWRPPVVIILLAAGVIDAAIHIWRKRGQAPKVPVL